MGSNSSDEESSSLTSSSPSSTPTKKMRIEEEKTTSSLQPISSSPPPPPVRSLVSSSSSLSSSSSSDEIPTIDCSDHDEDASSKTSSDDSDLVVPLHHQPQTTQPTLPLCEPTLDDGQLEKKPILLHHHVITPQSSMLDLDQQQVALKDDDDDDDASQLSDEEYPVANPSKPTTLDTTIHTDISANAKPSFVPIVPSAGSLKQSSKHFFYSSNKLFRLFMAFLLVVVLGGYRIQQSDRAVSAQATTFTGKDDSVCVDGGGFSGFWFTLGRLNSISNPLDKQYYCYSAGCLGVVAALSNYTKDEMLDLALDKQQRWKDGTLRRYDVVGAFIDDLIHGKTSNRHHHHDGTSTSNSSSKFLERVQDPRFLSSLNIITSQRRAEGTLLPGMLQASIRTPTTVDQLREMLLQTTWIPFAVGDGFFYDNHMDGAFTLAQHPRCASRVGLALDVDLLMNAVNVNLAGSKADKFWMAGLEYGL